MRTLQSLSALLLFLGLAAGSEADEGPDGASSSPSVGAPSKHPAVDTAMLVEQLNETCADLWCEGPWDYWFHDASCDEQSCVVNVTARIDGDEWEAMGKEAPTREVEAGWSHFRANDAPARVRGDTGLAVLVDFTIRLEQPVFEPVGWTDGEVSDWGPGPAVDEQVSAALEAYRP